MQDNYDKKNLDQNENNNENENLKGWTVTPNGSFYSDEANVAENAENNDVSVEPLNAEPSSPIIKNYENEPEPIILNETPINVIKETEEKDIDNSFNGAFDPFNEFNVQQNITAPPFITPKKKKSRNNITTVILSSVLAALIGAGSATAVMYYLTQSNTEVNNISSTKPEQSVTTTINIDKTASNIVEAVTEKAGDSVVGISTTAAVMNFFGGSSDTTNEGSGIIYSSDGYIITNYHVIEEAVESSNSSISVYLAGNTETGVPATVIGYNISSDLAVIKINKTGLPAIEFTDSSKLKVGQYAVAIGSPGGMEFMNSVSYGIISGLNRKVSTGTGSAMTLIQTDAAINPGNSGGALLNSEGKLVGVNSVKLVDTSFEGMGFAIPSNSVKEICDKIIAKQNDPTPYLGIEIHQGYTGSDLKKLGYPTGAVVNGVSSGGPAAESGIQRGDIITEFNGKAIDNYTTLEDEVANCTPGQTVTIKIYRAGRFYSTSVRVGANNAQ